MFNVGASPKSLCHLCSSAFVLLFLITADINTMTQIRVTACNSKLKELQPKHNPVASVAITPSHQEVNIS